MVYLHSDYIITPLGEDATANLEAIVQMKSKLQLHDTIHGEKIMTPVMASLLDEHAWQMDGYTLFESLCIHAIDGALKKNPTDLSCERCVFILSSTKGDIWISMADSARHIAQYFGNNTRPIVVSTACTSGVSAQITAYRLLEAGCYDKAVIVGCDVQCKFIISGFQCLKALSADLCKPFSVDRSGLNAGEAAACMILSKSSSGMAWQMLGGSIHNDANHISGPSRTAEGSLRCLQDALKYVGKDDLALLSVHGTGTLYNDEMEAIAIHRAGLEQVPVTALKGVFGHTMGAAGLLETILSLHALEEGIILPSKGFCEQGTTYSVNLSTKLRQTDKRTMIKMLSGFGGVNAAVAWTSKSNIIPTTSSEQEWDVLDEMTINETDDLVKLYRNQVGDWPKFFKMDQLSRLGFLSVELLLQHLRATYSDFEIDTEKCDLLIANRSASLKNDKDYQQTIVDEENYYPSPALFVYTLPNIVTGEIAIRHHLMGETICYILDNENEIFSLARQTLKHQPSEQAIVGWIECADSEHYRAHIQFWKKIKMR